MIPSTVARVPLHTAEHVNRRIRRQMEKRVAYYASAGAASVSQRLDELDQEWDIERTLEANAAVASLVGLTLGAAIDRRWLLFPAAVAGFLLQHAVQGWCPPLPVFRRLGVRTAAEINEERRQLRSLGGQANADARRDDEARAVEGADVDARESGRTHRHDGTASRLSPQVNGG